MKFKPFDFKPTKPFAFKPMEFKSTIPSDKESEKDAPSQNPAECEECLKTIHPNSDDFLSKAQCYECLTSACKSTPDLEANPSYQHCKESVNPELEAVLSQTIIGN